MNDADRKLIANVEAQRAALRAGVFTGAPAPTRPIPKELPDDVGESSPIPEQKPKAPPKTTTIADVVLQAPNSSAGEWFAKMTTAAGVKVPIDFRAVMRSAGFPVARPELQPWMLEWGLVTLNEARAALGLEAVVDGDRLPTKQP